MENTLVKNDLISQLIDVHVSIVFHGRYNYIFHSVGSISTSMATSRGTEKIIIRRICDRFSSRGTQ